MVILLMECNPDIGPLLDWVVDKCYTGTPKVADSCFSALATIFSIREYPCDHYTAIINVALMNTGCPRSEIQDTAFQLLQILDKRFFGSSTVPPVLNDLDAEIVQRKAPETLDTALSESFSRSQVYLSTQLANLHPELTMPIFSGNFLSDLENCGFFNYYDFKFRNNSSLSNRQRRNSTKTIAISSSLVKQYGTR